MGILIDLSFSKNVLLVEKSVMGFLIALEWNLQHPKWGSVMN